MLSIEIDQRTDPRRHEMPGAHVASCPHCQAGLMVMRENHPAIDSCGFESYRLTCDQCGTQLAGIVDPADDALLLSVVQD